MVEKWKQYWTSPTFIVPETEAHKQTNLILATSLLFALTTLPFLVFHTWAHLWIFLGITVYALVGFLAMPSILRITHSISITAHAFLTLLFSITLSAVYFSGGFHSPVVLIFTMLPLLSSLFVRGQSRYVWSGVPVVIFLGLYAYGPTPSLIPDASTKDILSLLLLLVLSFIPAAMAAHCNHQTRQSTLLQQEYQQQLIHQATHDAVTALPNRTLLLDRIQQAIGRAKRDDNEQFFVLFLGLDRFKTINDSLGHHIGDQFLLESARRLQRCLRSGDTIARFGGDKFVFLFENIHSDADIVRLIERLQQELAQQFSLQGVPLSITASVGVVVGAQHYEHAEELLRDAELAMYQAKEQGRGRYSFFDKRMHEQACQRLQIESELQEALRQQRFVLLFQPVFALDQREIRGVEALVRWQHPTRGLVSPAEFIPIAEQTRLIIPLGNWVMYEACRQLVTWQPYLPDSFSIGVNISTVQFSQPELLLEQVQRVIQEFELRPGQLKLEITESALMTNPDTTIETLQQLKKYGAKLAIDDFGTGYSSLSYLQRFPIDILKVDRSFIHRMTAEQKVREIVQVTIDFAHALEMTVVAEGIETAQEIELLQEMRCEFGQGFFFARPLPPEELLAMLRESR